MAKEKLDPEAEAAEAKVGAAALAVFSKRGTLIREYSAEIHGADFKKNAEEYAKKIGGEVRKAR